LDVVVVKAAVVVMKAVVVVMGPRHLRFAFARGMWWW
jgi:hypothetical protein